MSHLSNHVAECNQCTDSLQLNAIDKMSHQGKMNLRLHQEVFFACGRNVGGGTWRELADLRGRNCIGGVFRMDPSILPLCSRVCCENTLVGLNNSVNFKCGSLHGGCDSTGSMGKHTMIKSIGKQHII